jgi:5-hydroxyisourate hydrolase
MSSPITTHILDTSIGRPATGVTVSLERKSSTGETEGWESIGEGVTDSDGRVADLMSSEKLVEGTYRIHFAIGAYFKEEGREAFYPEASIVFEVKNAQEHYHVPLLLNPYGFSTYRGS